MLVFGGNTHNDTSMSHGAKCFSSDFMAYDLGELHTLEHTTHVHTQPCPPGHNNGLLSSITNPGIGYAEGPHLRVLCVIHALA